MEFSQMCAWVSSFQGPDLWYAMECIPLSFNGCRDKYAEVTFVHTELMFILLQLSFAISWGNS
jgi:hypothetical protein